MESKQLQEVNGSMCLWINNKIQINLIIVKDNKVSTVEQYPSELTRIFIYLPPLWYLSRVVMQAVSTDKKLDTNCSDYE